MENLGYLLAAYTVVWAVLFGYVLILLNRQRRLQREIESLKQSLEEGSTTHPAEHEMEA